MDFLGAIRFVVVRMSPAWSVPSIGNEQAENAAVVGLDGADQAAGALVLFSHMRKIS